MRILHTGQLWNEPKEAAELAGRGAAAEQRPPLLLTGISFGGGDRYPLSFDELDRWDGDGEGRKGEDGSDGKELHFD
jgi:hypothetical protein